MRPKATGFANFLCLTHGTNPYVYTVRIMSQIRALELIYERLIVKIYFLICSVFCTCQPYTVTVRLGPVNEFLISDLSNFPSVWEIYTYVMLERWKIPMSQLHHRYWLRLWVCIRAIEHTITVDTRRHCRQLPPPWVLTDVGDTWPPTSTWCSKWIMVSKILTEPGARLDDDLGLARRRVPWTVTLEIIYCVYAPDTQR